MSMERMLDLTEGLSTKADKMRMLDRHGYSRADIARFLGVRYQQVRNTLEGDKRTGYNPDLSPSVLGETGTPLHSARFFPVAINEDGQAIIPYELVEDFVDTQTELFAVSISGGIYVSDNKGMISRIEKSFG